MIFAVHCFLHKATLAAPPSPLSAVGHWVTTWSLLCVHIEKDIEREHNHRGLHIGFQQRVNRRECVDVVLKMFGSTFGFISRCVFLSLSDCVRSPPGETMQNHKEILPKVISRPKICKFTNCFDLVLSNGCPGIQDLSSGCPGRQVLASGLALLSFSLSRIYALFQNTSS